MATFFVSLAFLSLLAFVTHNPARLLRQLRQRARTTWRGFWLRYRPVDVHPEERRPLRLLETALRRGATLRFHEGTYYLIEGDRCTGGCSLDEVGFLIGLDAGKVQRRKPHAQIKFTKALLDGFRAVQNRGESLTAFCRLSMQKEIQHRQEEDRLALCGGFLDAADYAEVEVIPQEVARAA